MQVRYLKKFSKDLDKISQPKDRKIIADIISLVKTTEKLEDIPGVKKLKGFHNAFRIRLAIIE